MPTIEETQRAALLGGGEAPATTIAAPQKPALLSPAVEPRNVSLPSAGLGIANVVGGTLNGGIPSGIAALGNSIKGVYGTKAAAGGNPSAISQSGSDDSLAANIANQAPGGTAGGAFRQADVAVKNAVPNFVTNNPIADIAHEVRAAYPPPLAASVGGEAAPGVATPAVMPAADGGRGTINPPAAAPAAPIARASRAQTSTAAPTAAVAQPQPTIAGAAPDLNAVRQQILALEQTRPSTGVVSAESAYGGGNTGVKSYKMADGRIVNANDPEIGAADQKAIAAHEDLTKKLAPLYGQLPELHNFVPYTMKSDDPGMVYVNGVRMPESIYHAGLQPQYEQKFNEGSIKMADPVQAQIDAKIAEQRVVNEGSKAVADTHAAASVAGSSIAAGATIKSSEIGAKSHENVARITGTEANKKGEISIPVPGSTPDALGHYPQMRLPTVMDGNGNMMGNPAATIEALSKVGKPVYKDGTQGTLPNGKRAVWLNGELVEIKK